MSRADPTRPAAPPPAPSESAYAPVIHRLAFLAGRTGHQLYLVSPDPWASAFGRLGGDDVGRLRHLALLADADLLNEETLRRFFLSTPADQLIAAADEISDGDVTLSVLETLAMCVESQVTPPPLSEEENPATRYVIEMTGRVSGPFTLDVVLTPAAAQNHNKGCECGSCDKEGAAFEVTVYDASDFRADGRPDADSERSPLAYVYASSADSALASARYVCAREGWRVTTPAAPQTPRRGRRTRPARRRSTSRGGKRPVGCNAPGGAA